MCYIASGFASPLLLFIVGFWPHAQGLVSAIVSLLKADISQAVLDFVTCRVWSINRQYRLDRARLPSLYSLSNRASIIKRNPSVCHSSDSFFSASDSMDQEATGSAESKSRRRSMQGEPDDDILVLLDMSEREEEPMVLRRPSDRSLMSQTVDSYPSRARTSSTDSDLDLQSEGIKPPPRRGRRWPRPMDPPLARIIDEPSDYDPDVSTSNDV